MRLMTRWSLLLAVLTASIGFVPGTATADDHDGEYPSHAAPVYLIVSFDEDFYVGEGASRTILVNIGTFTGGGGILDTRFAANQALSSIPIPVPDGEDLGIPSFDELQHNASTLLGSFSTTDFDEVHMVTPSEEGVASDIQIAVFAASNMGLLDDLLAETDFPTTTQIADAIATQLPEGSEYDAEDVAAAVFGPAVPLAPADAGLSAAGEGEMFPHTSGSASLFRYNVKFDEDGDFESDVCLLVGIDIKPGSDSNPINIKKQGELPVAILTTDSFDATDVDGDTATIGGVLADKWAIEDVDDDGDDDMILHWDVPTLVDAGAIKASTTELTVRADLEDGSCVTGTDNVTIKTK